MLLFLVKGARTVLLDETDVLSARLRTFGLTLTLLLILASHYTLQHIRGINLGSSYTSAFALDMISNIQENLFYVRIKRCINDVHPRKCVKKNLLVFSVLVRSLSLLHLKMLMNLTTYGNDL